MNQVIGHFGTLKKLFLDECRSVRVDITRGLAQISEICGYFTQLSDASVEWITQGELFLVHVKCKLLIGVINVPIILQVCLG